MKKIVTTLVCSLLLLTSFSSNVSAQSLEENDYLFADVSMILLDTYYLDLYYYILTGNIDIIKLDKLYYNQYGSFTEHQWYEHELKRISDENRTIIRVISYIYAAENSGCKFRLLMKDTIIESRHEAQINEWGHFAMIYDTELIEKAHSASWVCW